MSDLHMPVETQLGNDDGVTADYNNQGGVNTETHKDVGGLTADIQNDGATVRQEDSSVEKDHKEQVQEGEQLEPMPDFDAENPQIVQAFEARFTTPDGGYNMDTLSQDFYANGGEGLSEGTYKWLETKGIDRETAKRVEAGQKALLNDGAQAIYSKAGGEANYKGAIDWAKRGGYTPAQRKAFNDALDAGGERAADAVDALMARARQANPQGFRTQRRQQPERSTANAGGGSAAASPAVKPYESYADYQRDLRQARKDNNQQLFNEVRRRGKASKYY